VRRFRIKKIYLNIDPDTLVNPFLARICERDDYSEEARYTIPTTTLCSNSQEIAFVLIPIVRLIELK